MQFDKYTTLESLTAIHIKGLLMCQDSCAKGHTLWMHAALWSLRMSYVYRLQSSFAQVKLNASMGFHAMALLRVCKPHHTTFIPGDHCM